PIGLSFKRDKIIATISIPPVDAPHFREIPTAAPLITPPTTAFSIISSDNEITGSISKKKVEKATESALYIVKPFPTLNQPNIRTGTLKINNRTPVLKRIFRKSCNILDTSCARPLNPLAYTFAVIKKKFKDIAKRNEPKTTIAIRLASIKNIQPPFLLRIITFHDNTDKQKLQFFISIFSFFFVNRLNDVAPFSHPVYLIYPSSSYFLK